MSNIVKIGISNVNLDALKGVSRSDIDKMYSKKPESWVDALWSHIEMLTPSKEEEPIKKKKKKTKNHTEE